MAGQYVNEQGEPISSPAPSSSGYVDESGQPLPGNQISPELLDSNKAVSRMQFESNLPESTIKSRAMEAARGILEPFDLHNVPGLLSSVGSAMYDAATGKGTAKAEQMVKAAIMAPVQPVKNLVEGISEGDYDKAAYGAGGILSQTIPITEQAENLIKRAMPSVQPGTAEDIYKTALKAPTTMPVADVKAVVKTALTNEIPISEEGVQKLNTLVGKLNDAIDAKVKGSGVTISPTAVASRLGDTADTMKQQVLPESDLAAVDSARQEFLRQHQQPGKPAIPPQPTGVLDAQGNPVMTNGTPAVPPKDIPISAESAQSLKKGTYRQNAGKYGELSNAQSEAEKALARGLKEELANQIPELTDLNAKEGALLNLNDVLQRAVNRAANANKGRLGPMIAMGVGRTLTGSTSIGTAIGIMKSVLDDPEVASKLAIAIDKAQRLNPSKYGPPNISAVYGKVLALKNKLSAAAASGTEIKATTTSADSSDTQ